MNFAWSHSPKTNILRNIQQYVRIMRRLQHWQMEYIIRMEVFAKFFSKRDSFVTLESTLIIFGKHGVGKWADNLRSKSAICFLLCPSSCKQPTCNRSVNYEHIAKLLAYDLIRWLFYCYRCQACWVLQILHRVWKDILKTLAAVSLVILTNLYFRIPKVVQLCN